jgi:hypothetical protein
MDRCLAAVGVHNADQTINFCTRLLAMTCQSIKEPQCKHTEFSIQQTNAFNLSGQARQVWNEDLRQCFQENNT